MDFISMWEQNHQYFKNTIIDNTLDLSSNCMKKKLLKAIEGHTLQKGTITGYFKK